MLSGPDTEGRPWRLATDNRMPGMAGWGPMAAGADLPDWERLLSAERLAG